MSERYQEILDHWGVDPDEAVQTLSAFVATPSSTGNEETMARLFVETAQTSGLSARLQEIAPGRFNALASVAGPRDGPSLLFNGHLDTSYTGAEKHLHGLGYKSNPVVRDGWLMGLGAYNMKSGLAAALMAVTAIARAGGFGKGKVTVAGVSGEIEKAPIDEYQGPEYMGYGFGTRQLVAHGAVADFGVVCEPTGFQISHGHLGTIWMKLTVTGHSTHTVFAGSNMDHAIKKAAKLIAALDEWSQSYSERNKFEGHPASVNIGAINGGWPWRISRTPADCHLYIDVRINPQQSPAHVLREVETVAMAALPESTVDLIPYVIVPALAQDHNESIFRVFGDAHRTVFQQESPSLFRGPMADAVHMVHAGITTVTYGLGPMASFDRVHPDTGEAGEHVRISDYLRLIAVYLEVVMRVCGENAPPIATARFGRDK